MYNGNKLYEVFHEVCFSTVHNTFGLVYWRDFAEGDPAAYSGKHLWPADYAAMPGNRNCEAGPRKKSGKIFNRNYARFVHSSGCRADSGMAAAFGHAGSCNCRHSGYNSDCYGCLWQGDAGVDEKERGERAMKDVITNSIFFGVVLSIAAYALGVFLKKKYNRGFVNPLLVSIVVVIAILLVFNIDYKSYNMGGQYLSWLLTPATVCLAIPLYQQAGLLRTHKKAILFGILAGVLASIGSVLAFAYLFGLDHRQYVTLLPKSITTAIGIGVSGELGGYEPITVAVIIITGVFGNIVAPAVCKLFKIRNPIATGIAIGSSSHVIGTTKALELGEVQGAMSSLSIVVAGLMTVVGASFFSVLL